MDSQDSPSGHGELTGVNEPAAHDDLRPGDRLGPYRVLQQVGRGGMGAVYLARRDDDQFTQRVAIKVVRSGMDGSDIVARFRQERQILAALEHDHIATLLDGGTMENGRPYLVMEFVEGTPIDEYCITQGLSIAERLALFRKVCSAVQYAHQNLVVHRDLKPGNVLVNAAGVPKLLDFGIAKLTHQSSAPPLLTTGNLPPPMTPEYASPEQARGEHLRASSDVYSLGVMLYELLTGRRPYDIRGLPLHEATRVICETEPIRPSLLVRTPVATDAPTSFTVEGTRERLSRRLAGDLDTIVLKALSKEPSRRYGSVEQFSEDIRRHLDGLPVIARPDTFRYRTGKFLLRHRGSVSAAALLALSLVVGIVATAWQAQVAARQRDRAEARFAEVRQLATAFLFEFHDAVVTLPGSTPARQLVVTRALQHLEGLAAEAGGDVALQTELAQAYIRVADVQGNPRSANLGDAKGAADSYAKARALLDAVIQAQPAQPVAAVQRSALAVKLGDVLQANGDSADAQREYEQAIALADAARRTPAARLDVDRAEYTGRMRLGDLMVRRGQAELASEQYDRVLPLAASVAEPIPGRETEFLQAVVYERQANVEESLGNTQGAIAKMTQALELHRKLAVNPQHRPAVNAVAIISERRGTMEQTLGLHQAAFDDLSVAAGQAEKVYALDPSEAFNRATIVRTSTYLSASAMALGRVDRARAAAGRALQLGREEADREGASAESLNLYAVAALQVEPAALRRPSDALRYARRAVDMTRGTHPFLLETLAEALFQTGDAAGAVATIERAMVLVGPESAQRKAQEQQLQTYRQALER